jgi:NAD(P)-dependent dehydrogenase (short-subunit alcohol dehydrogenase family)
MQLQSKIVLITGTSPNICGGIAVGMADAGAKVVCVDIQPEHAQRCADHIKQRSGEALGAVFLASDAAAIITGTDLQVDAGALVRYWMWDPSVPPA